MTATDPTGGVGYSWGQKLPSTHMTTIANQQPDLLDVVGGGTWTLGSDATLNGAGIVKLNHAELQAGGSSEVYHDITWQSGQLPKLTSRDLNYVQSVIPAQMQNFANCWEWSGVLWRQHVVTTNYWIDFPLLNLPQSGKIKTLTLWVDGDGGGAAHANKPGAGDLPTLALWERTFSTNTAAISGAPAATEDPAADLAAYELPHTITYSPAASEDIDNTKEYFAHVKGEDGADAVIDAYAVYGLIVTVTVNEVPP